jgi:hypothetical protein
MGKAILPTLDPIRNYSGIMKHEKSYQTAFQKKCYFIRYDLEKIKLMFTFKVNIN